MSEKSLALCLDHSVWKTVVVNCCVRYSCHWGSGLVLGHAHDFFVGIILEVSAEVGGQPLSTSSV